MEKSGEQTNNIESRVTTLEKEVSKLKELFSVASSVDQGEVGKKLSIKEFLLTKNIENDVRRTLAIGYFLEHSESMPAFNADDLRTYFRLAKCQVPTNVNDKVNLNIKTGYMMEAEEKKDSKKSWTLTASGEKAVESNFDK